MEKSSQKEGNKVDLAQFQFLYDYVLIKAVVPEGKTKSNLSNPDQYDDKPEFGEVVSVGEGILMDDGTVVPTKLKIGDIIFFGKYSTEQTRFLGQDYYILREQDIKARRKENEKHRKKI